MQIISCVRDFDMYKRCVSENPFNHGAQFTVFDQNKENKKITERYNEFLNSCDSSTPDWFAFCHEDWQVQEDWLARVDELDKNKIYGPIGAGTYTGNKAYGIGHIVHSDKDGSHTIDCGIRVPTGTLISTLDCQCLLVHSSLVNKYHLRFDEMFSYDLYAEDFCITAMEKHHIPTAVFQLSCHHFSRGVITERFLTLFDYLQNKWEKADGFYFAICQDDRVIGNKTRAFFCTLSTVIRTFFFYKKVTHSGKLIVKICKIPIFYKRMTTEKGQI